MTRARAFAVLAIALLQAAIVALVPLDHIMTLRNGRTVFLAIQPVDPYSILSGYHQILSYDISQPMRFDWRAITDDGQTTSSEADFRDIETTDTMLARDKFMTTESIAEHRSWQIQQRRNHQFERVFERGKFVYAIIEETTGPAWKLAAYTTKPPDNLAPNQAFLRGRSSGWTIDYGIEHFFFPEAERGMVEEGMRDRRAESRAEVKVDNRGHVALVALHIGDQVFRND